MGTRKKKFEFFPEHKCKMCDKMIPTPSLYCSSKCMNADKKAKNQEDSKEVESEIQNWFWANVIGRCDPKGAV